MSKNNASHTGSIKVTALASAILIRMLQITRGVFTRVEKKKKILINKGDGVRFQSDPHSFGRREKDDTAFYTTSVWEVIMR